MTRRRRSEEEVTADLLAYRQALDLIDRIDRMPAPEGVVAIGTPRAQGALELIGKVKSRFVREPGPEDAEDE